MQGDKVLHKPLSVWMINSTVLLELSGTPAHRDHPGHLLSVQCSAVGYVIIPLHFR